MFSFDVGCLHLFCSSFHKTHKTKTLHLFRLFLTFVFYGNTLYFCKVIIDKNNYEAKATYIPILGDRSSNGASGVHNIIPCEWCFGHAAKHSPFYHGSLLCCSKTHLPLCLSLSARIISLASLFCHKPTKSNRQTKGDSTLATAISMVGNDDIQMKRIELFHYEYLHEERQYLQQKEKEEDEKLQAVLQYTRNTFRQFDFSEEEIFQICECVRYFVTNRKALSVNIHIKRRTTVTQISLKNFAWNIAFQYNISRDITAQFVMQTFYEWFANSTLDTIRKNLRTTTGNHKIKIDEQIIKHPIISNWEEKTSIKQMREILIFINCDMMLMQTDSIKLMLKLISC